MSMEAKTLLAQFIANTNEFISVAKSISVADLKRVTKADDWSAAYVIHHMCDGDLHFTVRYLNCLAEESPNIFPFQEKIYPGRLIYAERDPIASLAAIEGSAKVAGNFLSVIPESDWLRTSLHVDRGLITLGDMVSMAIGHSKAHSEQLQKIIEAL